MTDDIPATSDAVDCDPWLEDEGRFVISEDQGCIAETMGYLKDNHVSLTLVDGGGEVCLQSLLVNITDGVLQLDKPLEWSSTCDSFRVFFRDMNQQWNFFEARSLSGNPFSLPIAAPVELYLLQRRSYRRVKVPVGTRALVKKDNEAMATVVVHDLSAAGMLMANDPAECEYTTDSIIRDIVVSIPPRGSVGEVSTARKILPLICRGRVVRSFIDQETERPCYGVSFHYDSNYVQETISQVVSEVESPALSDDSIAPD